MSGAARLDDARPGGAHCALLHRELFHREQTSGDNAVKLGACGMRALHTFAGNAVGASTFTKEQNALGVWISGDFALIVAASIPTSRP